MNSVNTSPRVLHHAEGFIFVILLLCSIYFLPRWADWNVNSRMNVALAVVDRGTLAIDDYYQNTGDYAFFNGHYYSDKAPATSFLAILVYAPYKFLGGNTLADQIAARIGVNSSLAKSLQANGRGLIRESVRYYAALVVVTLVVLAIPSAFLGVLLYRLLLLWAVRPMDALGLTLAYGLATPAFAYANNLYGHQLAAFLLIAAFYCVYRASTHTREKTFSALAGFALGMSLITEYPAALVVAGIGLYAIYKLRNVSDILIMIAAGLPPMLLAGAYNFAIFNTPLPVGYLYSPLYTDLHHTGLVSLTYPKIETLYELTFGLQRGLFLLSPFLLLAVPGFYWFARERKWRAEFFLILWAVVSFFLFNGSSAMWQGGFSVGPRYLVPMLPFLAIPVIFVMNRAQRWVLRAGIYSLFAISLALIWFETLGGQSFPGYQKNPFLAYSLPRWLNGNLSRNAGTLVGLDGGWTLLPLAILVLAIVGVFIWRERQSATIHATQSSGDAKRPDSTSFL